MNYNKFKEQFNEAALSKRQRTFNPKGLTQMLENMVYDIQKEIDWIEDDNSPNFPYLDRIQSKLSDSVKISKKLK